MYMHNDRTVTDIPDLEYAHAEEYGVRICMHTEYSQVHMQEC